MMTDKSGRPQANILLINDSGAVFTESIDCKLETKMGGYIASVLRPIIEKVGPANIVALCMDGGSNYAAACRELMLEYPHIEHVPCATHVMDLLMEDIGKMDWAKDIVAKAGVIITFVRAHHFTKGYMRSPQVKGGKGKQVLKPAGTRFGTQFIAVQRLCEVRSALTQMVLSPEWQAWAKGRKPQVEPFATMIMDALWWKGAGFFVALLKIPFVVMRKTDSTAKGMMGRMYDLMLQLTEDINAKLEEEEAGLVLSSSERTEVTNIVQKRWDHSMACAMHVVGRILNPVNQEEGIFRTNLECTRVFKAFVARHYAGRTVTRKDGEELRASHVIQDGLAAFNTLQGSFGLPDAISDRELMKAGKKTVVQWWTWHGTEHPELTTLASRVLSQPVSGSACERNWAVWESIHSAKRNRLGSEKCRDLVYVAHNWNIVRNWHKGAEWVTVLPGNIPEASLPEGYNEVMEEDEEEGEEDELEDEYNAWGWEGQVCVADTECGEGKWGKGRLGSAMENNARVHSGRAKCVVLPPNVEECLGEVPGADAAARSTPMLMALSRRRLAKVNRGRGGLFMLSQKRMFERYCSWACIELTTLLHECHGGGGAGSAGGSWCVLTEAVMAGRGGGAEGGGAVSGGVGGALLMMDGGMMVKWMATERGRWMGNDGSRQRQLGGQRGADGWGQGGADGWGQRGADGWG
ncbi:unnamed protein product [Closterium sp. NIES-65]|nr:unnamed protein product [Closterium sp. NIES-65]